MIPTLIKPLSSIAPHNTRLHHLCKSEIHSSFIEREAIATSLIIVVMGNFYSLNAYGTFIPSVRHTSHLLFSCSFKCSNCLRKASPLEKHQSSADEDADADGRLPIPADADADVIQTLTTSRSANTTQGDDVEECEQSSGYSLWPRVFLSHSGKQKNFARHLFKELMRENISCFFDEHRQSLPKGEPFPPRIFEAAMNCKVAVVVLSEEFISSKWPMEELCAFVKAKNTTNKSLKILPLFFQLSPESLAQKLRSRDLLLKCWRELGKSQKRPIDFDEWIKALEALRPINGVRYIESLGEVAYIEQVVDHIRRLLPPNLKYDESGIQGKHRLCQELTKLFDRIPCRKNGVKVGGMHGVGGIGKTTIARILCNFYSKDFHGRVFHAELGRDPPIETLKHALRNLCDANESLVNSVTSFRSGARLLKEMMNDKRVFLAVDNISDISESIDEAEMYLNAAGKQSMILLTSRSSTILKRFIPDQNDLLHVPSLEEEEAIGVLLQRTPLELSNLTVELKDIARKCVQKCCFSWQYCEVYADHRQYHPFVLRIFGVFVYDKFLASADLSGLSRWIDKHNTGSRGGMQEVFQILKESFMRLSAQHRHIFMLLSLYMPERHMALEAASYWLAFVCDQEVEDIEFAIIELKRKGFTESTQESRLGLNIHDLLIEFAESVADGTGKWISLKGKVEIPATLQESDRPRFSAMKFDNCHFSGMVNNELFTNTSVLHLEDMRTLKTVDLSAVKIVRSITIVGCTDLEEIRGLESLAGLGYLLLKGCTVNSQIYTGIQCVKTLRHLEVDGSLSVTAMRALQGPWTSFPPSQGLSNLGTIYPDHLRQGTGSLDLIGCSKLQTVLLSWCSITRLDLTDCLELGTISIQCCSKLREIRPFGPICSTMDLFPRAGYANLTSLELTRMYGLEELPGLSRLTHLTHLRLEEIGKLKELPSLNELTHLTNLRLEEMGNLKELPDLSRLTHLTYLWLEGMGKLKELPSLDQLTELTYLRLEGMGNLKELPSLDQLTHLTSLWLEGMGNLKELPSLDQLTHLIYLRLEGMGNLKELPSLSKLTHLTYLRLEGMRNLEKLPSLSELTHLTYLRMEGMRNLKELPSLSQLTNLTYLRLEGMRSLEELPSLSQLTNLTSLWLERMDNLKELPSLSQLTQLTSLELDGIANLKEIPGLSQLTNLTSLSLWGMDNLKELPDLAKLYNLRDLELRRCAMIELPDLTSCSQLKIVKI